ncbi:MAG: hypothetical protein Q8J64_01285 [Thermodesulfovibrionales bacterium]|nr:hypothetical protein [Thermodesulfovibrionales bacterium]
MLRLPVLLMPKFLSFRNSVNKGVVLRRLPFMLIGLVFAALLYIGAYKVLYYIRDIEFIGEALSKKLLSMVLFSLTGFLLLSNIITAISSFYLSRDIPFLLTLPLKRKEILALKTYETVVNSSWMVASFVPPVFLAYGVSYAAPPGYYLITLIALILFMLLTSATGITIAHVMTRLFPAKGMRDMLLFISLVLFLVVYFMLRASAPGDAGRPEELLSAILSFRAESPLLPNYWVLETVWESLGRRPFDALYPMALLSSAAFFLVLSFAAGVAFYGKNLEAVRPKTGGRTTAGIYPGMGHALLYKDFKVFVRDTGQWSQLLIIGALLLVYVYNFKSFPVEAVMKVTPLIREIIVLINMLMAGLVLSAVSARFVYSSVSLEGQAFWVIRSSPISMGRFLWGKFSYGFLPLCLITTALVFLTNLVMDVRGILMFASIATVILLSLSISGLGTGLGAMYPKFNYENIASVSMSLGGMVFMSLAFGVVALTVLLEAWPFYMYYKTGGIMWPATAVSVILMLALNFAAFYLPMRMGIKKLNRLE